MFTTGGEGPPVKGPPAPLEFEEKESENGHVSHPYERVPLFPVELTTFLTL